MRAGFTRADDSLPASPAAGPRARPGPSVGQVVDLEPMLDEYYIPRGWDVEVDHQSPN